MSKLEGRLKTWNQLDLKIGGKRTGYSGYAYYNGTYMRFALSPSLSVTALIALAYHELMHCYGYRHKQGCEPRPKDIAAVCKLLNVDDPAMLIPKKIVASHVARNLVEERYQHMLMRQRTWATKLNRAQKAYEKVTKEITAYQRRHGERINGN